MIAPSVCLTTMEANEPMAMILAVIMLARHKRQVKVEQHDSCCLSGTDRRSSSWYDTSDHEMDTTPSRIFHACTASAGERADSVLIVVMYEVIST